MNVEMHIVPGPVGCTSPWALDGAGAVVRFDGIVRPSENDQSISALDYATYSPMTERELEKLAAAVMAEYEILALRVSHSRGRVKVGECSFRLEVAAAHRKPALAAMDAFIDRMKQDVPIWKLPVWAGDVDELAVTTAKRPP